MCQVLLVLELLLFIHGLLLKEQLSLFIHSCMLLMSQNHICFSCFTKVCLPRCFPVPFITCKLIVAWHLKSILCISKFLLVGPSALTLVFKITSLLLGASGRVSIYIGVFLVGGTTARTLLIVLVEQWRIGGLKCYIMSQVPLLGLVAIHGDVCLSLAFKLFLYMLCFRSHGLVRICLLL